MRCRAPIVLLLAGAAAAGCSGQEPAPAPPAPAPPAPAAAPAPEKPDPPEPMSPLPWELESDPVKARTLRTESNLRLDPTLVDRPLSIHTDFPFLFVEIEGPGPSRAAEFAVEAQAARRDFLALLAEAGIEVPPAPADGGRRLVWILFPTRESFDAWHFRNGLPAPGPATRGYHTVGRDSRVVVVRDGTGAEGIRQLAVLQMLAEVRRVRIQQDDDAMATRDGEPSEQVQAGDSRLHSRHAWFDRGLSLALSAPEDGRLGPPNAESMAALRAGRRSGSLWPLGDFLLRDSWQMKAVAKMKSGGFDADGLIDLHARQSWLLLHTLHTDPRWREGLFALVRMETAGKSGVHHFHDAFGLPRGKAPPPEWVEAVERACLDRIPAK